MGKNEHPVADRWGITLGKSPARQEKVSDLSRLPVADLRELAVEVQGEKKLPRGVMIAILSSMVGVIAVTVSLASIAYAANSVPFSRDQFLWSMVWVGAIGALLVCLFVFYLVHDPEPANRMWREKIEQELRRRENEPERRRSKRVPAATFAGGIVFSIVGIGCCLTRGRSGAPNRASSTAAS